MEKDKRIFSFRIDPVGNLLDGNKERKQKGGGRLRGADTRKMHHANARKMRRALGMLLAAALLFNTLPVSGLAVSASGRRGDHGGLSWPVR